MKRFVPVVLMIGGLAAVEATVATSPARAQSGLEQVERLTRLGRTEEAREALLTWWDEGREDANRGDLQRGLWLRGRLTVDPVQAGLDFRRLVILYPSGPFTPDALFRLAQASYAMGDEDQARAYVETLRRDYSRSSARDEADRWLADAGPVPPSGDTPTRSAGQGPAGETGAAAAPDPIADDPPAATERAPARRDEAPVVSDAAMNYYVQLGAFAEQERAVALYEEVLAAGVDARVVHVEGSRFTHVRVGRFAERAAAVDLLEELTARGLSAALVRDDRPERPVG